MNNKMMILSLEGERRDQRVMIGIFIEVNDDNSGRTLIGSHYYIHNHVWHGSMIHEVLFQAGNHSVSCLISGRNHTLG